LNDIAVFTSDNVHRAHEQVKLTVFLVL
jgi:hypothetical protein